jgi:hypothetical protein
MKATRAYRKKMKKEELLTEERIFPLLLLPLSNLFWAHDQVSH